MSEETGRHLKPVQTKPGIIMALVKYKKFFDGSPLLKPI